MRNSKMFNQMPEAAKWLQGRTKDREGTQGKHNGEDLEEDKKMFFFKNPNKQSQTLRKEREGEVRKLTVQEVNMDIEKKDDTEKK